MHYIMGFTGPTHEIEEGNMAAAIFFIELRATQMQMFAEQVITGETNELEEPDNL